jgi:hypothetical protein
VPVVAWIAIGVVVILLVLAAVAIARYPTDGSF